MPKTLQRTNVCSCFPSARHVAPPTFFLLPLEANHFQSRLSSYDRTLLLCVARFLQCFQLCKLVTLKVPMYGCIHNELAMLQHRLHIFTCSSARVAVCTLNPIPLFIDCHFDKPVINRLTTIAGTILVQMEALVIVCLTNIPAGDSLLSTGTLSAAIILFTLAAFCQSG